MIALVPVLELSPWTYGALNRSAPAGSAKEDPLAWQDHWKSSLADSGIIGLDALPTGSGLVAVTRLTPEALRVVLRTELRDTTWELDTLVPLSGGFVLTVESAAMTPGCCADLGDLREWVAAAECNDEMWRMHWVGHPWSFVRSVANTIYFTELSEQDTPEGLATAFSLERSELRAAVASAERELALFHDLLVVLVAELRPPVPPPEIARILVYGHDSVEDR